MPDSMKRCWVAVLAGGDGKRVQTLTLDDDRQIRPKQYFPLGGGSTPFQAALARACHVVPSSRIVPIVAAAHRKWWAPDLEDVSSENVIVQPFKRGTAIGALAAMVHVLRRDPSAGLVMLPGGHMVAAEPTMRDALEDAIRCIEVDEEHVFVLGAPPADRELDHDWILPARHNGTIASEVSSYVTRLSVSAARRCAEMGGLWSTMILAGSVRAFSALYACSQPVLFRGFLAAIRGGRGETFSFYQDLPGRDLSRDLLALAPQILRVIEMAPCGWNDLATHARLTWFAHQADAQRSSDGFHRAMTEHVTR